MRVGMLTGGGDVPGLNACIKAGVNRLAEGGHQAIGIRRGWLGLLACRPEDRDSVARWTMALDPAAVRTIDRSGGTILHTSRTNPGRARPDDLPGHLRGQSAEPEDFTAHVLSVIQGLGIDALLTIGGDDTLSYALHLHEEGMPVVAVPKTMDNDVHGTDYCIGFSTAVTRSVRFIHDLRTSAGSHERLAVIELFGRYSGETSLVAAYLAGVDRAIISEVPFDVERLAQLLMEDKRSNPSGYAMVTISEGAQMMGGDMVSSGGEDAYGHRKLGGIGAATGETLKRLTGQNIIYQQPAYLMRSGAPDSLDVMVAMNYAVMAADLAMAGISGRLVALRNGSYTDVPLEITRQGEKRVDVDELYDLEGYRPKVRQVAGKPMFLY